jgi:hypothetical protein
MSVPLLAIAAVWYLRRGRQDIRIGSQTKVQAGDRKQSADLEIIGTGSCNHNGSERSRKADLPGHPTGRSLHSYNAIPLLTRKAPRMPITQVPLQTGVLGATTRMASFAILPLPCARGAC